MSLTSSILICFAVTFEGPVNPPFPAPMHVLGAQGAIQGVI